MSAILMPGAWGRRNGEFVIGGPSSGSSGPISHASLTGVTPDQHHAELHTVGSHTDTTATGAELNTLTAGPASDADGLHTHPSLDTGGDVVGPASSGDSRVAAFDGATGKLIKQLDFRVIDGALCCRITQSTGGLILKGTPIAPDPVNDDEGVIASNATEEKIIGVCMEDSNDAGSGGVDLWIAFAGVFPVRCTGGAIARGNFLQMSGAVGLASDVFTGAPGVFAMAMTAKPGGTPNQTVLARFIKSETF